MHVQSIASINGCIDMLSSWFHVIFTCFCLVLVFASFNISA